MAGLTREGFTPDTYTNILTRIKSRLETFSPGIDLSAEAPDGHLAEIFSFELSQLWAELGLVYNSYNPNISVGAGLRNIGMLTGLAYGAATRSQTLVSLIGTSGTSIPKGSLVADAKGNNFKTSFDAIIPANVQVISVVSGPVNVDIGAITTIVSPISGWTSVTNTTAGRMGSPAQTETQYRNLRNKTVMRNFVGVVDVIKGRLLEVLKIEQVVVINNDQPIAHPDGTPANTIHVTVGEVPAHVTDEQIARVILSTKGLGCPTHGTTSVTLKDDQGNPKTVKFSKAVAKDIFMKIEVLFLSKEYAGAEEAIISKLVTHINSLDTDEDVVWSRLFGLITPYAKAQVNMLEISSDGINYVSSNIAIGANEFAATTKGNIAVTVAN